MNNDHRKDVLSLREREESGPAIFQQVLLWDGTFNGLNELPKSTGLGYKNRPQF